MQNKQLLRTISLPQSERLLKEEIMCTIGRRWNTGMEWKQTVLRSWILEQLVAPQSCSNIVADFDLSKLFCCAVVMNRVTKSSQFLFALRCCDMGWTMLLMIGKIIQRGSVDDHGL